MTYNGEQRLMITILSDGSFGIITSKNTIENFPKMNPRNAIYGKRIEYKGEFLSKLIVNQPKLKNVKNKLLIEIIPATYFDKFGYKINIIFATGKEMEMKYFSDLIPLENKSGIYFAKYRCPIGDCIMYDENKTLTIEDVEKLKFLGKIKENDIYNIIFDNTIGSSKEKSDEIKSIEEKSEQIDETKLIENDKSELKIMEKKPDDNIKIIEKNKSSKKNDIKKLKKKKKMKIKKYINDLYTSGCIHHEIFILYLASKFETEYINNKQGFYELFNSYSVKFMDLYPINILIGTDEDVIKKYGSSKHFNFPKK